MSVTTAASSFKGNFSFCFTETNFLFLYSSQVFDQLCTRKHNLTTYEENSNNIAQYA